MKDDLKKLKEILSSKMIYAIDKIEDKKKYNFIILFINPEKRAPGHIFLEVDKNDKVFKKEFKKILIKKFNTIKKGYNNWKKIIKSY